MDKDKFKNKLLDVLSDEEVIMHISDLLKKYNDKVVNKSSKKDFDDMSKRISDLNMQHEKKLSELLEMKKICQEKDDRYCALLSDFENMKEKYILIEKKLVEINDMYEMEKEKNNLLQRTNNKLLSHTQLIEEKLKTYEENFSDAVDLYSKYKNVSEERRNFLMTIVSDKSLIDFISSCVQFNNIEALWDYIKTMLYEEHEDQEVNILISIFEHFFLLYNNLSETPLYLMADVNIGDEFDDDYHIRGNGSKVSGKITSVQLRGYKSAVTNKYKRKSIVIVGK